ncbi:MAG TPA: site-2 protease family protein [Coriobacteriia bacterium]|nr:site-2 protease family protein [Coriobacteriia bacterium]
MSQLVQWALRFALILPAIILHEVSHGYVAYLLGDPTAKRAGRLTLNPLKHIDPFGTILLPILLIVISGTGFGYAKPVPVNPNAFKDYRKGFFLTAIAGPTTNIVLAALSGLGVRLLGTTSLFGLALLYFASANLVLVFFNLIPIPPLDGSRIIPLFLSDSGMQKYHQVEQYGFAILMLVLWGVPALFNINPIGIYLNYTVDPLLRLFVGF